MKIEEYPNIYNIFSHKFSEIANPDLEVDLAIMHESSPGSRRAVAFGRGRDGFYSVSMAGEPLRILTTRRISEAQYETALKLVVDPFAGRSVIAYTEDILDGECFLARIKKGSDFQFIVICNPDFGPETIVSRFSNVLKSVVRRYFHVGFSPRSWIGMLGFWKSGARSDASTSPGDASRMG